jgi:hypothetical protein
MHWNSISNLAVFMIGLRLGTPFWWEDFELHLNNGKQSPGGNIAGMVLSSCYHYRISLPVLGSKQQFVGLGL